MNNLSTAISVDITLHIGLLAITIALWISRIPDLREAIRLLNGRVNRSKNILQVLILEIVFRIIGLLASVAIVICSFEYFLSLEEIVGPFSEKLDYTVFQAKWEDAEWWTKAAINYNMFSIILFTIEYLLSFIVARKVSKSLKDKNSGLKNDVLEKEPNLLSEVSPLKVKSEIKLCGKITSTGRSCKRRVSVNHDACSFHRTK